MSTDLERLCHPTGAATADTLMMQAFQNYKAAWNRHDVPALVNFYEQNGTLSSPAIGQPASGQLLTGGSAACSPRFPISRSNSSA
ncbi:MAG: hypothetical protein ACR2FI_04175 [Burkholderiales bacterium]